MDEMFLGQPFAILQCIFPKEPNGWTETPLDLEEGPHNKPYLLDPGEKV